MEQTESGIIVPDGTLEIKHRVWDYHLAKLIEKLAKELDDAGQDVQLLFVCELCREHGRKAGCVPGLTNDGSITLTCGCTKRRLSKDRDL